MTTTHDLTPQAAHRVIAARLSGETQYADDAAGLYIDTVDVDDQGLKITVVDEHDHALTVTLNSAAQVRAASGSKLTLGRTETRTVRIPARDNHDGRAIVTLTLPWTCPSCGGPRGEIKSVTSYDGSMRLVCDGWDNPCGYIDNYTAVRREAKQYASTEPKEN